MGNRVELQREWVKIIKKAHKERIPVYEPWKESYKNFQRDMLEKGWDGNPIQRIVEEGGFYPENMCTL